MSCVYVLRSGDSSLFKIGRTDGDVDVRIRQLATGNPEQLALFDHIDTEHHLFCEGYLHKSLRSRRSLASGAREFFQLAPEELRGVLQETREFLAEFVADEARAQEFSERETDGVLLKPGDGEGSVYKELVAVRQDEDVANFRRRLLENKLKVLIAGSDGFEGMATWKKQPRQVLDQVALKAEQPEMHGRYLRTENRRVFRIS